MAIYYANSPGYGTDLPLSWTDLSLNLPDKMDFWAFLYFSWKFCPFFFVLVSGPFLHLEHWPKKPHHLCRLSFSWKGNFLKRCSWSALYWHPSVPLILFCQAIILHFKVLQTLTSIFFSKMTVSIHVHVYPPRSALTPTFIFYQSLCKKHYGIGPIDSCQ